MNTQLSHLLAPMVLRISSMPLPPEVPIVFDVVQCTGDESQLADCSRATYVEGCTHSLDAGVNCTTPTGKCINNTRGLRIAWTFMRQYKILGATFRRTTASRIFSFDVSQIHNLDLLINMQIIIRST